MFRIFKNSKESVRLELYIILIFILSSVIVGYHSYQTQLSQLEELIVLKQESNIQLFKKLIDTDKEGLSRAMAGFSQLESIMRPFKDRSRAELAAAVKPIFKQIKLKHEITHVYFIDKDGIVFLRAHKPEQYGDHLIRTTYVQSSVLHDLACGIEMGKNFYSLRCVQPIIYQGEFIGYLEMAQEIDHVFHQIKETVSEDISMLLTQEYVLSKNATLGLPNLKNYYILDSTNIDLIKTMLGKLELDEGLNAPYNQFISFNGEKYAVYISPFMDAAGVTPGVVITQRKVTALFSGIWKELLINATLIMSIILGSITLIILSTRRSINLLETRVTERTRQIEHMAFHDSLTGLPNRAMFSKFLATTIAKAKRYDHHLSVLFIDLDNFKIINDTLGHDAGDDLLKKSSARISACLRESDFVARLGGDEFVVILPENPAHSENTEYREQVVAQKILAALAEPFIIFDKEFKISASIGISSYPDDGRDEVTLTRHADIAMYEAKDLGKNKFFVFTRVLAKKYSERKLQQHG